MKFCKYKFNTSVSCLVLLFSNHAFSAEYTVKTDIDNASGSLRDVIENVISEGDFIYLGDVKDALNITSPIFIKNRNISVLGNDVEGNKLGTSIDNINSLGQSYIASQNWVAFDQNGDFNNQINTQITSSAFDNMTHILATGNGNFISNDALGNDFNLTNIAFTSSNVTLLDSSALFIHAGITNRSNPKIVVGTGNISNSYLADNSIIFTNNIIGGGIIGASTNLANSKEILKGAKSEIGALNDVIFNNNSITTQASMFGGGLVGAFGGSFISSTSTSGDNCSNDICFGGTIVDGSTGKEHSSSEIKDINNSIFNGNIVSFLSSDHTVYLWGAGLIGAANNNGLSSSLEKSSITIGNIENSIFSNNNINSVENKLKLHGGGLIGATAWDLETPITLGNLNNNIFSSNSVTSYELYGGGLIGLNGQGVDVEPESIIGDMNNNLFINNKITSFYIRGGGLIGIASSNGAIGSTSNSYFYNNTIEARGYGGTVGTIYGGGLIGFVISSARFSPAVLGDITDSQFIKNTVSLTNGINGYINNFGLIGIYNQGSDGRPVYFGNITNTLFNENSVTSTVGSIRGGLIYSSGLGETMNIQNSQFVNNTLSAPNGVLGTIVIDLNAIAQDTDSTTAHIKLTANDNEQTVFYKNGDQAKNSYNSIYFAQALSYGLEGSAGDTPQQDAEITVDSNGTGLVNLLDPIKVKFGANTTNKHFTFSKQGDGLMFLGGANNITGFTTNGEATWSVDSGEMRLVTTDTSGETSINMEKNGNTQFAVSSDGTVSGSGSVTASDIVIKGTLSPSLYQATDGNTVFSSKYGRLNFLNDVTLNGATYDVDVAKTDSDYIYTDGDINSTNSYINVASVIYENASIGNYDGYEKAIMEASGTISGDYKVTIDHQALNSVDYLQGIGGRIEGNKYILNVGFLSWKSSAFDKTSDKLLAHGNFTLENLNDTFVLTEGLADRTDINTSDTLSNWDGMTLNKKGNGTLILDGINTYTGLTTVEAGTLVVGDEQSPSAEIAGNTTVESNAILSGTGTVLGNVNNQGYIASYNSLSAKETAGISNFNVGELTNSGIIRLAGDSAGNTLTVNGNYFGNNGSLLINTVLGDSYSVTDKLIITGATSGNTSVVVTNRGGLGALTTGNGIEVVKIAGVSLNNAFSLSSDYQFKGQNAVVGGAYVYSLYHNGINGDENDGNWYLRSLNTTPVPDPINPDKPTNPVYQPGAPLYETYPQALLQINQLGTLEQRVGNRVWLNPKGNGLDDAISATEERGFWMKIEGAIGHVNPKKSTTHSDYDIDMIKTFLGVDFNLLENNSGKLISGIYLQYNHAKTDVSSRFGKGDIKTNGYGFGGTFTWYGSNDVYIDGVAQAMWYKSNIKSDTLDKREVDDNKGTGYALSIETGKKYMLNEEYTLTPQVQLSYNSVDFDSFRDAYQAKISNQDSDALTGRFGVALDREIGWRSESGYMSHLKTYGIANLYYEFLNGTEVTVTGVKFHNHPDRVWGGLGGGLSHSWKDGKYSIYGELAARSSFADFGNSYSLNGTLGFRAKF